MKTFLTKLAGLLLISATILILTGCPKETDMPEEQGAWVTRIFTEDKEKDLAHNDFFSIDAETQTVRFYFDATDRAASNFSSPYGRDDVPFEQKLSSEHFVGFECIVKNESDSGASYGFDFNYEPQPTGTTQKGYYRFQICDDWCYLFYGYWNPGVYYNNYIIGPDWEEYDIFKCGNEENIIKVRTRINGNIEIYVNEELLITIEPLENAPLSGFLSVLGEIGSSAFQNDGKTSDISYRFTKFQVLPD